jgi:hypothetical protein
LSFSTPNKPVNADAAANQEDGKARTYQRAGRALNTGAGRFVAYGALLSQRRNAECQQQGRRNNQAFHLDFSAVVKISVLAQFIGYTNATRMRDHLN